jgi:CRP-like cAMP-binding protein
MQYFDYEHGDSPEHAEKITVFNHLTQEEWGKIICNARSIEFSPGDLLLQAGETDDALYIVASGEVEVVNENSFGFVKRIALIGEGSVFGELAFFDNQPRSASIRAITSGEVLRISRQGFEKIAAWNPRLAQQFLLDLGRILAYRFRNELPYKI